MSLVTRDMAAHNGDNIDTINDNDHLQVAQRNGSTSHHNGGSRDYNAPPTSFSSPKPGSVIDRVNNGLADFFSTEVFQIVLHNPTTAHRLLKFSQARMCGENMEFLEKVYIFCLNPVRLANGTLHRRWIATTCFWTNWRQ